MKKTLIIGMLLASAAAFAYPGQDHGPRDDMPPMLFDTLNLTTKQQEQLHAIRKEARDERMKLMDKLDDLRFNTRQKVMAVLTDEQKKTLQEQRASMLKKRMSQGCQGGQMPPRAKMSMKEMQRD